MTLTTPGKDRCRSSITSRFSPPSEGVPGGSALKFLTRRLIVFVRVPRPGRVKTRLAAVIGNENACALYRVFVMDLMETLELSGAPYVFAYDPPEEEEAVTKWLGRGHS